MECVLMGTFFFVAFMVIAILRPSEPPGPAASAEERNTYYSKQERRTQTRYLKGKWATSNYQKALEWEVLQYRLDELPEGDPRRATIARQREKAGHDDRWDKRQAYIASLRHAYPDGVDPGVDTSLEWINDHPDWEVTRTWEMAQIERQFFGNCLGTN